jgi:hypothetical protein
MSKNYFSFKTGHKASDVYFKNTPQWFDSDIFSAWVHGVIFGILISLLFIILY